MSVKIPSFVSVVLSGGAGMRLWPASREGHPKPFLKLPDGETLIEKTYARIKALDSDVLTVTNRDYYFMSRDAMGRIEAADRFILEPFGRNTAPAIALAAKFIEANYGSEAIMLVLAADHLVSDQDGFSSAVLEAVKMAKDGYLVTFGIEPDRPETGFGYIEIGAMLGVGFKVNSFIEKPDLVRAKKYVASGKYLWNSGIFCFKVNLLLKELGEHAPQVAEAVDKCWLTMAPLRRASSVEIPAELFKTTPDISIDKAVMEKSDKVALVRGNFGWNDVGSWNAICGLVEPDHFGNRVLGEATFVETQNTFVQSQGRMVAAVGVCNLIIVDTPDALLVVHPNNAQEVKKVVAQLKIVNHDTIKMPRTVARPWGTYTVLEQGSGFKIKKIEVKPGASLSLQLHNHRSEHWVVVSGAAKITNGSCEIMILANESTYIPAGQKHRLENPGAIPCVMIEVQCGAYLEEDDIIRFDDKYGR